MKSEVRNSRSETGPNPEARKSVDLLFAPICAMTFDVGGTLIQPWPSVGRIYAQEAARHGFKGVSPVLLNRRFGAAWRALKDFRHTRAQWSALVDATFSDLIETRPSETFFSKLFDRFAEAEAWRIYEDVLPVLDRLVARGMKLGIISNWDDRLRPLLRKLKLDSFFQTIVVSCEVDSPKPAAAIFVNAAAALGVRPNAILHVGDSPEMDLRGARAAGLQSVLLCRSSKPHGRDCIHSLRELC